MVSSEIIRRFVAQIKLMHPKINEPIIEKDFHLTLLLNEISESIEDDKNSSFAKLVFKGGTLLTRTHLNYHRISEDLDFTYLENEISNKLSAKQRKKFISEFTDKLVNEISKISKKHSLDFSPDKSNEKYCKVMDRKNVYLFKIHYRPVYGAEEFVKLEVNFNDELIYPYKCEEIKHLFDEELIKDLEFVEGIKINIKKNILCYDLREIAVEKIRAILTRPAIKERDLLDLFLISKSINISKLKKEEIIKKIIRTKSFVKGLAEKIATNIEMLTEHRHDIIEEKDKLVLIEINEKEYLKFEKEISLFLVEVGKDSLLELT
ncbi:nucleotidyl transferase AbiEii/AbiGii toxin family protein [Candidatus Woesearchaeota archaeon]|nr:nucleotidyl transferase AbiEii/AbiGii toxin family protein [Candidatus Woesearchaeota archaeon]